MKGDVNSTRMYYSPGTILAREHGCTCVGLLTVVGNPKIDPRCPLHGHMTDPVLTLGDQS